MARYLIVQFLVVFVLATAGCGGQDGPEKAAVSGEVKLSGAPLPNATVMFVPSEGPVAATTTNDEGQFEFPKGVTVGPVKVTVEAMVGETKADTPEYDPDDPDSMAKAMVAFEQNSKKQSGPKSLVPKIYTDIKQTPLSYEIKSGEDNQFTIEIKK